MGKQRPEDALLWRHPPRLLRIPLPPLPGNSQELALSAVKGGTFKSRLCPRCFKTAVEGWLTTARHVLFEGVVHRQVVLTVPTEIRPLILAEPKLLKAFADAGARAVQQLVQQWRPKKKIKVGIMSVLHVHGWAGNTNPHLHMVLSEGGVDKRGQWQAVNYFDTRKRRKLWQYHVLTALRKAVRGTAYAKTWSAKLGRVFAQYPTGFDCHAMPESGPVERLVIYLCKYVSSPPISIRRIESYDGERVTFRYDDHRRGPVQETLTAVVLPGRLFLLLPAKYFPLVRYYGMYARTVRNKVHALVADVLAGLQPVAQQVREWVGRRGLGHREATVSLKSESHEEAFADMEVRCPRCGAEMILVRVWSASGGVLYDLWEEENVTAPSVARRPELKAEEPPFVRQLVFAFARG